ncbi:25S rRNA (adenine2142-N1)-methyltransferase [Emydomyces testavorans]|uniref:25S rRNA adenine-N(1) methyltransferase n=1 Tax=Emydomyces testavorans TaxID=2070801 RepID=A0AAF0DDE3_9EURO|nr:25S rRNA (adenine2142-N1)-methyltransferase [Emydomyces testavorans]
MGRAGRNRRPKSLSYGRPPTVHRAAPSLSAKATRNLIRSHHQLQKARARALADGNQELVCELDKKIVTLGGIESYQMASKKGQSKERGGDSSKILMEWLKPTLDELKSSQSRLRLLEVGALSTRNACSTVSFVDVTRIDLHSQEPGILPQDFMERPLPATDMEKFHVISLSLVLNYVPDPTTRGEMLRRTTTFLLSTLPTSSQSLNELTPCLFLVLPAACLLNSRYFTEKRLEDIMSSLGYSLIRKKLTSKLIYQLWKYNCPVEQKACEFKKEMLNPGSVRNNFTVILKYTKLLNTS